MTAAYRDAMLEYLAMGQLQEDLRGERSSDYELRNEVARRLAVARAKLEEACSSAAQGG